MMQSSLFNSKGGALRFKRLPAVLGMLSTVLLSSGCSSISNSSVASSDTVIRSAYASLEELFQTEIINIGLEQLGYTPITGSELEYDVIHQAIAQDYLDYTAVHWYPIHKDFFEQNGGRPTLRGQ